MEDRRPPASARAMAAIVAWVESRPPPRELFGDAARWLPVLVFVAGTAGVLFLLSGPASAERTALWATGAVAVPVWILRIATLEDESLRAARYGAALPMVSWWLAGVAVVSGCWVPAGPAGVELTMAAALLFLFLAHGRYVLARDG